MSKKGKEFIFDFDRLESETEFCSLIKCVRDAMEVLSGKWKIPIVISITMGSKRFKEISKNINGITDRMLSKELKDLETNQLIVKTITDTFPPTVEYAITNHGKSLKEIILHLGEWGARHRNKITEK